MNNKELEVMKWKVIFFNLSISFLFMLLVFFRFLDIWSIVFPIINLLMVVWCLEESNED